ncbi:MAG TPA: RDD family protein, partial [Methylomirabilota bacterium]|nr:RDD family protein [Methylomirabilota bacterium]
VGFWARFLATLLDFALVATVVTLLGARRAFLPVWVIYHMALWAWRGTTLGGIVLGLKIVRTDGSPLNAAVAIVRALAAFFSALVLFLGFFWAGWSRERQSWHDRIAGTLVVRMPKGASLV